MPRRSMPSLLQIGSALALAAVLAGCTKGGQFDPTEILNSDAFDSKKKLKGDREAVFPNGVPGTTFGVPPDLVKGYQPPPDQSADTGLPPAPATKATAAEKSKATAKPKPRPRVAKVPAQQAHDPAWDQNGAAPPGAAGQRPAQSAWPSPQSAAQTNWPAPPSGGQSSQAAPPAQTNWPAPPPTR